MRDSGLEVSDRSDPVSLIPEGEKRERKNEDEKKRKEKKPKEGRSHFSGLRLHETTRKQRERQPAERMDGRQSEYDNTDCNTNNRDNNALEVWTRVGKVNNQMTKPKQQQQRQRQ